MRTSTVIPICIIAILCGCRSVTLTRPAQRVTPATDPAMGTGTHLLHGPPIHVMVKGELLGDMRGLYLFEPNEPCTLLRLLPKMGGLPPYVDPSMSRVVRRGPDGKVEEFHIDARAVMFSGKPEDDVPLRNGDQVILNPRLLAI